MKKTLKQGLFYFMAFSVVLANSAVSLNINFTNLAHAEELALEKVSAEPKVVEEVVEPVLEEPAPEPAPEQPALQELTTVVQDKYTVCHATGSGTFNRLNLPASALVGHFENNGTPLAGHEDDVLLGIDNASVLQCPTIPYPVPVVGAVLNGSHDSVLVTWDEITDGRLDGYKVVMSETDPTPSYPPNYIAWITNSTVTSFNYSYQYVCGQDYYFSVTALYDGHDESGEFVPGNAVTINFACEEPTVCGDGILESPEFCDDGNQIDGDGCTANCSLETGYECEDITSQNGWYGMYYNYLAEHPDMNLPSSQWPDIGHGDPMGTWNADWYGSQYYKFNRVDSNLEFGGNFFPMDFAAEEIHNGHDYHFGVHWRAEVTAPVAGNYEFSATSDDDVWVYMDGVLVAENPGIHAPSTVNGQLVLDTNPHIVDIFFAERHVTQSHMSFDFASDGLIIVPMPEECEDPGETATVIAHKIVCDSETDLPNWSGGADITATTAQDYVARHPNCHLEPNWKFEWGSNNSLLSLNGDYIGEHNVEGWHDFDSLTDANGQAEVVLNLTDLPDRLWFREILQSGYIPFSFPPDSAPGSNVSAEFWCNNDVANYDNAEWIDVSPENTYYCVAFNVEEGSGYSPYCGDGVKNQEWEDCDPGMSVKGIDQVGCSEQCQFITPECSDLVLAKINVDDVQNSGLGDMTSDLFLGADSYRIPSNVWIALYYNGSYYNDPSVANYEDVPGLAVQRYNNSLRTVMHGSTTNDDKEHVDGYIELYNATMTGQRSDDATGLPNWNGLEGDYSDGSGIGNYNAGDDEIWQQDGNSHYWLTTTTADDGFWTDWSIIQDCQEHRPYAPWCSALLGMMEGFYNPDSNAYQKYNSVIDMDGKDGINLTDVAMLTDLYFAGEDNTCYEQFVGPEYNDYHFQCEDIPTMGWCEGLVQGVKDSIGGREADLPDSNYFYVFDLYKGDGLGVINLSDVGILSQLITAGNESACYAYYPFFDCETGSCGDGNVDEQLGEVCDGNEQSCTTDYGYAGIQTCNMPELEKVQSVEIAYCQWNPCYTEESCGDEIKNGNEECDTLDGVTEGNYCTSECILESIPVNGYCGDGVVNNGEECDAGTGGSSTCSTDCHTITPPGPTPCTENCGGGGGGGGGGRTSIISNVNSDISCVGNVLSWVTSKNSNSWVVYGTTPDEYTEEYKDNTKKTGHSIILPDLDPNTTYYFKIKSDGETTVKESAEYSFITMSAAQCGQVLGVKEVATCDYVRPSHSHGVDVDVMNVFEFPDGTLLRDGCHADLSVYLIKDQMKWHVPNWQYLNDHYRGQRIYNVMSEVVAAYENWHSGNKVLGVKYYADGTLLRGGDKKIYVLEGGKKHYIPNLEELQKYAGHPMFNVSDEILNQY